MKVAICIPCYGDPKAKFMQSLAAMITHTLSAKLKDGDGNDIPIVLETFIVGGSMLTESRHMLVAEAMAWEADYMLWLDADHVFPHDALCRLWAHNLPIVGCNYARRSTPTGPTAAYTDEEDGIEKVLYTTEEKARDGVVEPCAHLGFGVLLVNMRVYDVMQAQAEKEGRDTIMPLFVFETDKKRNKPIGEDVYFFKKARAAGITPFCDHGLSWEVGHCHDIIMTNAHTITQRDKWEESRNLRGRNLREKIAELEKIENESLGETGAEA